MRRHLILCLALGGLGCSGEANAPSAVNGLVIGPETLAQAGQGPLGLVPTDSVFVLLASYPIGCAEPWGSESQHIYTSEDCGRVDWHMAVNVPAALVGGGDIAIEEQVSTLQVASGCGTDPESVFGEWTRGSLSVTPVSASEAEIALSDTDPRSDGTYLVPTCE